MSYWDDINEGFGAIRYNYYNDRYAYGKNSLNSSNRVSSKETAMNFRAKRLKEIYEMNRKTFGGIKETKTFKVNENVEATSTITLASGYIRSGVKGVVAEVYDNSYVIDFGGRAGKVAIAKQVAEESFVARPVTGTRDILRKTIEGSLTVGDSINIGDRVVDAEGRQYAIEQADVFGRRFKALSENGVTRVLDKSEVKKAIEDFVEVLNTELKEFKDNVIQAIQEKVDDIVKDPADYSNEIPLDKDGVSFLKRLERILIIKKVDTDIKEV